MVVKLPDVNHICTLRLMASECSAEEQSGSLQKQRAIIEERCEEERLLRESYRKQHEKIKRLLELCEQMEFKWKKKVGS